MCLSVPGKIIELKEGIAIVDYKSEKRKAKVIEDVYQKGDYVIIQGGMVLQKIERKEALSALRLYNKVVKLD